MTISQGVEIDLKSEFSGLNLGDARREARLRSVVGHIAQAPEKSFPKMFTDDAAGLEGFYRLVNNPHVCVFDVLKPHLRATQERCREAGTLLALSDTTELEWSGATKRKGLGPIDGDDQGMLLHLTLMVDAESHRPLGVGAASLWTRPEVPEGLRGKAHKEERRKLRELRGEDEHRRWANNMRFIDKTIGRGGRRVVHVGDRETDSYDLLAQRINKSPFVFRLAQDRVVVTKPADAAEAVPGVPAAPEPAAKSKRTLKMHAKDQQVSAESAGSGSSYIREALKEAKARLTRTVTLSTRKVTLDTPYSAQSRFPARKGREAKLEVGAMSVRLKRPAHPRHGGLPPYLDLNVVYAREVDAPPGEAPVEWLLYTNHPTTTSEEISLILDYYRARWNIEIYFDALKNGCNPSGRQLESFHALSIAIAVFLPIAWKIVLLRVLADEDPTTPGTAVLSPLQITILRCALKETRLSENPSAKEVLRGVAALGGHIKKNGRPGWRVLARGYEELLVRQSAWHSALEHEAARVRRSRTQAPTRPLSHESRTMSRNAI